jgi:hypothetical protein
MCLVTERQRFCALAPVAPGGSKACAPFAVHDGPTPEHYPLDGSRHGLDVVRAFCYVLQALIEVRVT